MKVVEKIGTELRIVKYPSPLYRKPFVVQKKTEIYWFNIPTPINPRAFRSHQEARNFAQKFAQQSM